MKIKPIIVLLLIIINILALLYFFKRDESERKINEQLHNEYLRIYRDSTIGGIVDTCFTYIHSNPKGTLYITLQNGIKLITVGNAYPRNYYDYEDHYKLSLSTFLNKGDSIYKPHGRDSLYVIKKDGERFEYFMTTKEYSDSVFHRGKYKKKNWFE